MKRNPTFKKLKKQLEELYPYSNVWEVLHQRNIFFNVKTGFYQSDLSDLVSSLQKEKEIKYLESRIQELIDLGKRQEEKIVQAYSTYFSSGRELAEKVIRNYLEYIKFKKEKSSSPNYYENCKEYKKKYEEAEEKLQFGLSHEDKKDVINEMQRILTDFEKLVDQEVELESKLDTKILTIKEKKQILLQMPINNEEKREKLSKLEMEMDEVKKKLNFYKEQSNRPTQQIITIITNPNFNQQIFHNQLTNVYQIQYNQELVNEELAELKQRYQALETTKETLSDPQKLKKTILFLGAEGIFIAKRKETIKSLIETYEKLDNSVKIYDKVSTFGNYVSDVGDAISIFPPAGITLKLVGKAIPIVTDFLKSYSHVSYAKKFGDYLIEDEKSLVILQEIYHSFLIKRNLASTAFS
ncbi:MAG: hypothetical protein MRERC_1c183 [Mycoplasmataceae bacterium RC_NB112A]|nr:MAG: hypothetical protein MRERC_1c183 [Mycoplasmataceae bacterium RC_NB112A]